MRERLAKWRDLVLLSALVGLWGCGEGLGPTLPGEVVGLEGGRLGVVVGCEVEVSAEGFRCGRAEAAEGDWGPRYLIVGNQDEHVRLASSEVSYDGGTGILQASVTVQNLIGQALGTPDGKTVTGLRVFFHHGPVITGGTGTVSVANADDTGDFTGSGQPYFEYMEILRAGGAPPPVAGETSQPRLWEFSASPDITFEFWVFVDADVEYPDGWVEVDPEFAVLGESEVKGLGVEVRDVWGDALTGASVAGTCVDRGVATAAGAEVTGVGAGVTDCELSSGVAGPDTARVAVVGQSGFAGIVATGAGVYRMACGRGSTLEVPLQLLRPAGGDGELASISGTLVWDAAVLSYVSSTGVASGWSWFPNASSGQLGYAAFATGSTASDFELARVTFSCAGAAGSETELGLSVSVAGDALGDPVQVEAVSSRLEIE